MNANSFLTSNKSKQIGWARRVGGFSVAELLVVLGIIAILSVISIPYIFSYRKLYHSEDQAMKVMDLMQEAGQLAMTRRRTIRLEIDLTDNAILIVDEDGANPDKLVKLIPLEKASDVRVDTIPSGVSKPNPPNYNNATFANDAIGHLRGTTSVSGHLVWAARFARDGSVLNAGNSPISVNLFFYPPLTPGSTTPRNKLEIRAITLFGGSGAIRYWKYNGTTFVAV